MSRIISILVSLIVLSPIVVHAEYDPAIKQAQRKLHSLGYQTGPADGYWGSKTESAIRAFQRDNGIPETGLLETATLEKLRKTDIGVKESPVETVVNHKSCAEVLDEWIVDDAEAVAKATGIPIETIKQVGMSRPTIVAPAGCSFLATGSKFRPHCNGIPLTEESCDLP